MASGMEPYWYNLTSRMQELYPVK
uniref:Uncharacterized protein n=1 Tax=Arundo donax TaxID=35708 RepID=A0A0A8YGZ4_ARUDO